MALKLGDKAPNPALGVEGASHEALPDGLEGAELVHQDGA